MTPVRSTPAAQPMTAGSPPGSQERPGDPGERRRARVEHVAIRGRDPVRDRLVGHERQVPVADLVRIAEDAGTPLHLVFPADVDHLADPKVVQRLAARRPGAGRGHRSGGASASGSPGRRRQGSRRRRAGCASRGGGGGAQRARVGRERRRARARRLPHRAPARRRGGRATPAPPRSGWPGHGAGPA